MIKRAKINYEVLRMIFSAGTQIISPDGERRLIVAEGFDGDLIRVGQSMDDARDVFCIDFGSVEESDNGKMPEIVDFVIHDARRS